MGCSVHTGRSAPAKTGGRPHFAQNGHFGDAVCSVGRGRSGAPPLAEEVTLVHSPRYGARRGLCKPFLWCTGRVHGQKRHKIMQVISLEMDRRDDVPSPCRSENACPAAT